MTSKPVAIVTAASKGIGAACARDLAQRGFDLVLLARSDAVVSFAEELGAVPVMGSVENESDLRRAADTAVERFNRIDAVVNNSGHAPKGELLELSDDQWHAGFELLLMNVVRIARLVTPQMLKQQCGSIINISTFGAVEPSLTFPISSVMRAALGSYTKLFSTRYAGQGLRMSCVLPGFVDTYPADEKVRASIPAGRLGTAEEIAKVVTFLASDESRYLTGQNVLVDGGLVRSL